MQILFQPNTSEAVANAVRHMIVDGELAPGERINEVRLSQQLGVSRTPLREALARLAHEGALDAIPRIGHFVRPLTVQELEQVYQIRPLLDPEALRLAGLPSNEKLQRLRDLNESIEAAREPDEVINADDAWHLELVSHCPNRILIDLIRQFMHRTRRYEVALMRERGNVQVATTTHRTIIAALERGDLDAACSALRENLESGKQPIIAWLEARETASTKS
jgi:DNA-binding GntR family transcriptional regulator